MRIKAKIKLRKVQFANLNNAEINLRARIQIRKTIG